MSSPDSSPAPPRSLLPSTYVDEIGTAGETTVYDVEPKQWGASFWATFHFVAYA